MAFSSAIMSGRLRCLRGIITCIVHDSGLINCYQPPPPYVNVRKVLIKYGRAVRRVMFKYGYAQQPLEDSAAISPNKRLPLKKVPTFKLSAALSNLSKFLNC